LAEGNAVSFLDPLGLFDGGGSSSSASVTSTVNLDVQGLDKIGVTETIELKPIEIKPLTINENIDLKPVTVNENIDLKPITLNENIDLKPVAVDTCQTLRLAPLPETTICNPYRHHVAMNLFGLEFMSMTFHGQSEQEIHSPRRPQVTERTRFPDRGHEPSATVIGEGRGIRVRVVDDNGD
jgi:hypothetical protein